MGALNDCEAIVDALFGQPVNSITSLAFVVAGGLVVRYSTLPWVGVALIATGVGSFLFHGPMPAYGEWAHDVSLAWVLFVVAGSGRSWARWTQLLGLAALGIAFALLPEAGDPTAIALTVIAGVLILGSDRSMATLGPLALLAIVGVVGRLGSTGGPWCDPDSVFQPHGLWHVGAAVAVTWWAMGRFRA